MFATKKSLAPLLIPQQALSAQILQAATCFGAEVLLPQSACRPSLLQCCFRFRSVTPRCSHQPPGLMRLDQEYVFLFLGRCLAINCSACACLACADGMSVLSATPHHPSNCLFRSCQIDPSCCSCPCSSSRRSQRCLYPWLDHVLGEERRVSMCSSLLGVLAGGTVSDQRQMTLAEIGSKTSTTNLSQYPPQNLRWLHCSLGLEAKR